jgi:hypothetical protein
MELYLRVASEDYRETVGNNKKHMSKLTMFVLTHRSGYVPREFAMLQKDNVHCDSRDCQASYDSPHLRSCEGYLVM